MARVNDNDYLARTNERMYRCPICGTDCEDKDLFKMHMREQHYHQYKRMDLTKIDELELFNSGDTDVLNI